MLHTPLKHLHAPSVGGGSHPSPAHAQATASSHASERELNLADWLHVSPNQSSLMSPTHAHSLAHALPLQVVGPYSPYAPSPSPYASPSSNHLHQQQSSSPYYFVPSPSHQSTSSAFAPSGYGRNDFLAPPTSAFSTPTNISIHTSSLATSTTAAAAVDRKDSLETSVRSPIVDVPRISVSSSETDEEEVRGRETDSAYAYSGFFEGAGAMGFADFPAFSSSSMHPHSAPLSPIDYHSNDHRALSSLTQQDSQEQESQVTTLTAYDDSQTQNHRQQPGVDAKSVVDADGRDQQQHISLLDKLRAASPVTEAGGSSAGSTPAPRSTLAHQQQARSEASHTATSSPSPFLAAPVPRAHPNTAHASLTHLSCPSPLSRGSSPLAELAELASRRSSAASSPLTPLPPSVQSSVGPAHRSGEGVGASALEKSLAEALVHQLPLSRPVSRPNSALSVRSTQSASKHHSPSRGATGRKSHSIPLRPRRFPASLLRVSLPLQPSHSANNVSSRERDASVETAHLPRGPLDPVSTSGYLTRSRGSRTSAEELEKREREADLELIKLGASPAAKKGEEGWGLEMLASVSVTRRLGVDTKLHPPHLHLNVGEKEREGRWSRASSLTPLSSSVATPSPVMGPTTSTSRGRQTRGVKRGFSEEMHHVGSGERDGSAKRSRKPIEKAKFAKSASRSSSIAVTRGKGGKNSATSASSTPKARSASAKTKYNKRAANAKRAETEDDEETEVEVLDDEDLDAEGETVEEDELDLDAEGEEDDGLDGDAMELDGDGDYEPSPASVRGRASGAAVGKKAGKASISKAGANAKTKGGKKGALTEKEKKRPAPRKAASARSVTASRSNAKLSRTQSSSAASSSLAIDISTPSSFKTSSRSSTPKDKEPDIIEEVDLGSIDIPTRNFPDGVPVHASFPLLYRRFPACSFVGGVSVTSEGAVDDAVRQVEIGREGTRGRNAGVFKVSTPAEGMEGVETFVTTANLSLSSPSTNTSSSSALTPSQSPASSTQPNSSSNTAGLPHVELPSTGHFNTHAPLGPNDLYTPRFVRGVGREKAGLCPICYEPESRGGRGKQEWLSMKFSAFNYHMQYFHGVSPQTFLPFSPPVAFRLQRRAPTYRNEKNRILEGKCHSCGTWAAVEGIKCVEAKLKEIYWWKHAASCHKGSTLPGEHGAVTDDAVLERVEAAYARMFPLDPPPKRA